jgi:hypothetical protein
VTRAVRALVGAQVVSSLGSLMTAVALPWFVLETTCSATRRSVVLAAGPALEHGDASLAWVGIAAVQSVRGAAVRALGALSRL